MKQFKLEQPTKAFVIQPSDSVDIESDTNNLDDVPFVYVCNNTATGGIARVIPAGQRLSSGNQVPVDIYIPAGYTHPMPVRRVYSTALTITTVLGQY